MFVLRHMLCSYMYMYVHLPNYVITIYTCISLVLRLSLKLYARRGYTCIVLVGVLTSVLQETQVNNKCFSHVAISDDIS